MPLGVQDDDSDEKHDDRNGHVCEGEHMPATASVALGRLDIVDPHLPAGECRDPFGKISWNDHLHLWRLAKCQFGRWRVEIQSGRPTLRNQDGGQQQNGDKKTADFPR